MMRPVRLAHLTVALLVAAVLNSCSPLDAPTAPATAPAAAELRLRVLSGLLACIPQPYARTVQVVGSAGGVVRVGGHTLVIPRGALSTPTTITAEAPADAVASVRFQPEGLHFLRQATLTLDYSSCPAGRLQILKRVAYTTDQLDILSFLLSRDDLLRMRVSADLEHFSRYAVAW
jgi:hypothetical protein